MKRGVVRTGNNPIGDYTEWLVCKGLDLRLQRNSSASFDALDYQEQRYQIKGRRAKQATGNVQLGVIRNLERQGFDFLIAVVYRSDFTIRFAAKIPHSIVNELAKYRAHVNGHVPIINECILDRQGVVDITGLLEGSRPSPSVE